MQLSPKFSYTAEMPPASIKDTLSIVCLIPALYLD